MEKGVGAQKMVVFDLISKPMSHIEKVLVILYIISIFIYKWLFLKSKRQILLQL